MFSQPFTYLQQKLILADFWLDAVIFVVHLNGSDSNGSFGVL